uniref:Uncharacterized protein n=1 Tax=Homalodisca liturata TaxID=320908 RepID=A0A1B6J4Y6_9HEMI
MSNMFTDFETESAGFSSNWNSSRASEDSSVQTTEVRTADQNLQAVDTFSTVVQTEYSDVQQLSAAYDETRLAAFLGRVCPAVVQELDRVCRSNALNTYTLAQDSDSDVRELLKLSPPADNMKVSQLSWSCTGSVLAVAHSHTLHPSWCSHQGHIALYNVDRESRSPSRSLEPMSCVRSISMHPYLSSVVVAGTFSGEVLVWDTAREGSEASLVNVSRTTHADSVTQVRWVLGTGTAVTLVSSGTDGHLYFWKVSPQLMSYQVLERYCCDTTNLQAGISCFAFPHHKQDMFVVALEGGALHHCSASAAKPVASEHLVKDPVISSFEPQPATVTCVEFSPHHDDVFATVSTDQTIRIYSLFQRRAEREICGVGSLVGLCWAPAQAHVLAGWGDQAVVSLYNSHTGDTLSPLTPDNTENKAHISAAAFNTKSTRLFAIGDIEGTTHVWKIPSHIPTKPMHL